MTENDLRYYVSRAVTLSGFCIEGLETDPVFEEDLRMILETGARFIGRSAYYSWSGDLSAKEITDHFRIAREQAELVHSADPDIILQAAVFEIMYKETVDNTEIPKHVFDAFGLEYESRTYKFNDMLFPQGSKFGIGHWGNDRSAVPCILNSETKLYFYDLITRYIDAGYEAMHLGQAEMMMGYGGNDLAHHWAEVTNKARSYAVKQSRRGFVLFDCHTAIDSGGIKVGDRLVMDVQAAGIVPNETEEENGAMQCRISGYDENWLQWIGRSDGGIHPLGFEIENNLTILEFDNYGGNGNPGVPTYQAFYNWGHDDITWFALQPEWYRNKFLVECYEYLSQNHLNSRGEQVYFLQPSFKRVLSPNDTSPVLEYIPGSEHDPAYVTWYEGVSGSKFEYDPDNRKYKVRAERYYKANRNSDVCPDGFGQENIIRQLFKSSLSKSSSLKTMIAVILATVLMACSFMAGPVYAQSHDSNMSGVSDVSNEKVITYSEYKYLNQERSAGSGTAEISTLSEEGSPIRLGDGTEPVNYEFVVQKDGLYRIEALYYPVSGNGALDINLSFMIDEQILFEEAEKVYLPRIYRDAGPIVKDSSGNDLRPPQKEAPRWNTVLFQDNTGYNPQPFEIYLTQGKHSITISVTQEQIELESLSIIPAVRTVPYYEVLSGWQNAGYTKVKQGITIIEAEGAVEKSSSSIYPISNRVDAATSPSDPSFLRLNALNFGKPGDRAMWEFSVPETGLYRLSFRVLQDTNRGIPSTRRILINGVVPFSEADAVEFPFNTGWYTYTLSDAAGEPWLFYLESGKTNTITLESNTGRLSQTLSVVREAVLRLNEVARKITMVTGITPDLYRDYDFREEIPDLDDRLKAIYSMLNDEMLRLQKEMGYEGNELLTVRDILRQLSDFIDDQRSIPSRLGNFRTNISTLGSWLVSMTSQNLTIDQMRFLSESAEEQEEKSGFFQQMIYDLKAIIGSFLIDYNSIGGKDSDGKSITVWASSGRDQANIVRRLIDNSFAVEYEVPVALSLVSDSATLLQATLAGKGPDIALFVEKTLPVNLAARGALTRLDGFEGFPEIKDRFHPSAWIPYTFLDGVYAVPNSQGFNVMFVRTDIFDELEISIPETWDDFYKALPVIQRNNMQVGIGGEAPVMFETLILQHGGTFYKKDMGATAFDSTEVLNAFKMWTGFYSEYSLSLVYDIFSYFRSGVMPLVIADYTQYNQFAVAAPEIRGLWSMYPIPGLKQSDGSISRRESSTGTGAILMAGAKEEKTGFAFLDWWSRTETQRDYALELEMIMGPAARYNTANMEAVRYLPWAKSEVDIIEAQWNDVWDIETIPSSYYVARNVANAFRNVVYNKANERETLNRYGEIIDKEILRKNRELGLD